MAPKLVLSSLALVVVFFILAEPASGLKCNVCYDDFMTGVNPIPAPCEALPCDSSDDVKNALKLSSKQQGREEEPKDSGKDTGKYACIRVVVKNQVNVQKVAYDTSTCGAEAEKFPPSDSAYPLKDFIEGSDPSGQVKSEAKGEVYVCNAVVGSSDNCGENAKVKATQPKGGGEGEGGERSAAGDEGASDSGTADAADASADETASST